MRVTVWRWVQCALIHAGRRTLPTAIPATTAMVSTRKSGKPPTSGRTASPSVMRTPPAVMTGVKPARRASGTAPHPISAKRNPGRAVRIPAVEVEISSASANWSMTGAIDAMPARRLMAAATTAVAARPKPSSGRRCGCEARVSATSRPPAPTQGRSHRAQGQAWR